MLDGASNNGAPWETETFRSNEKVAHVTRVALRHFVEERIMTDGDYSLALVTDGQPPQVLDNSETLAEAGVHEHAVLALVPRSPQVDG